MSCKRPSHGVDLTSKGKTKVGYSYNIRAAIAPPYAKAGFCCSLYVLSLDGIDDYFSLLVVCNVACNIPSDTMSTSQ